MCVPWLGWKLPISATDGIVCLICAILMMTKMATAAMTERIPRQKRAMKVLIRFLSVAARRTGRAFRALITAVARFVAIDFDYKPDSSVVSTEMQFVAQMILRFPTHTSSLWRGGVECLWLAGRWLAHVI